MPSLAPVTTARRPDWSGTVMSVGRMALLLGVRVGGPTLATRSGPIQDLPVRG
jgi:hypothetical protein